MPRGTLQVGTVTEQRIPGGLCLRVLGLARAPLWQPTRPQHLPPWAVGLGPAGAGADGGPLCAGILAGIARSHSTPLTRAFSSPDFLQRLLACAFAPAICVQVPTSRALHAWLDSDAHSAAPGSRTQQCQQTHSTPVWAWAGSPSRLLAARQLMQCPTCRP